MKAASFKWVLSSALAMAASTAVAQGALQEQVDALQVNALQVNALQVGALQVGALQVGALHGAKLDQRLDIQDPALVSNLPEGGWIAFSVPQLQTERSPCCWKGKWDGKLDGRGEAGCELKKSHQSYGTRNDSPIEDQIIVYNQIRNGKVSSTLVAGESCPVDAGGASVTWIGGVGEQAGLDWLAASAQQDEAALYALGLHRSKAATAKLVSMVRSLNDDELSEQAVFWLGEARGQQGFEALKQLLTELPPGETRHKINFALAQNDSPEAADLLVAISESDRDGKQRSDALFWLAQGYPQRARPALLKFVHEEHDEEALEQAVLAISQLGDDSGDKILMELARDEQVSRVIRRQALFWLAQSDNDETVAELAQLLSN